jgi:hypothetical protein
LRARNWICDEFDLFKQTRKLEAIYDRVLESDLASAT